MLTGEELTTRETRRVQLSLMTARLTTVKTSASYDLSFQSSLDRNRVLALAQLLHHALVIAIEGNSCPLREHDDLVPEHLCSRPPSELGDVPVRKRRRGRPPKERA